MSKTKLLVITIGIASIILAAATYIFFKNTDPPIISMIQPTQYISPRQPLTLTITSKHSPLKLIQIIVKQNEYTKTLINQPIINGHLIETVDIDFKKSGLQDGPFELIVKAQDSSYSNFGKGNISNKTWDMNFDSQPPQITIHSPTPSLHKGSATAIAFTVSKPVAVVGVQLEEKFFPAFQQANGTYYCFFPFPIEFSPKTFNPKLFAQDLAGNKSYISVHVHSLERSFKIDTLTITDTFLDKKMPNFEQNFPDTQTQVERYIKVNSILRIENEKKLIEISKKTSPMMLWSGKFHTLPRAAVKATFGENRTYMYQNQKIDQQFHMGLDLASTANAPIPAANDGIVVYTGDLGIYGNIVIIDHGLGLQTLYSHLSKITAKEGDVVKKGDLIGHTGMTGLAGGDHLHFGFLVGGIQVNPIDWLDPKWIKNTIITRLNNNV